VSSTVGSASWTEVGPTSGTTGFLPNAPGTALTLFNSGGQKLLRGSTYGRGIWQYNLVTTADYQLAISNSPLTAFSGQTAVFNGIATAVNGYTSRITLNCVAGTGRGATATPATCTISPSVLTPGSNTPFTVTVGGAVGTYNFNIQGVGADPDQITQSVPAVFHVVAFALGTPSPATVSVQQGSTSSAVSFEVTAAGSCNQSVTLSCSDAIAKRHLQFQSVCERDAHFKQSGQRERHRDRSRQRADRTLSHHNSSRNGGDFRDSQHLIHIDRYSRTDWGIHAGRVDRFSRSQCRQHRHPRTNLHHRTKWFQRNCDPELFRHIRRGHMERQPDYDQMEHRPWRWRHPNSALCSARSVRLHSFPRYRRRC
jgi:hypothetical protein